MAQFPDRTNTNPRDHLPNSNAPELKDDGSESSLMFAPLVWLSRWLDKSAVKVSLKGDGPQFQLESQPVGSHSIVVESFHPLRQLCLNLSVQIGSSKKKVSPSKMSTTVESTSKRRKFKLHFSLTSILNIQFLEEFFSLNIEYHVRNI